MSALKKGMNETKKSDDSDLELLLLILSGENQVKALRAYYNYQIAKEETKQAHKKYVCMPLAVGVAFIIAVAIVACTYAKRPTNITESTINHTIKLDIADETMKPYNVPEKQSEKANDS